MQLDGEKRILNTVQEQKDWCVWMENLYWSGGGSTIWVDSEDDDFNYDDPNIVSCHIIFDQHENHLHGCHMSSVTYGHAQHYHSAMSGLSDLQPDVSLVHMISNTTPSSSCTWAPAVSWHTQLDDTAICIAVTPSHHSSQGLSVVITPCNSNCGPLSPFSGWGP